MEIKKKKSQLKIEKVFVNLIQKYELDEIKVADICKLAGVNRATFYVNYLDVYDLADKIKKQMFYNMLDLFKEETNNHKHSYDYLKLFNHIKENQFYYKTMMKLKFDFSKYTPDDLRNEEAIKYLGTTKNLDYHVEFFKAGMNAMITKWLENDCKESPKEMAEVLRTEYQKPSALL